MTRPTATFAVLCAVAAFVAGCGSSGPKIPQSNASELITRLQEARGRSDFGKPDCKGLLSDTLPALQGGIGALPPKTDKDIRATLKEGIDNLRTLVQAECSAAQNKQTSSTTTTTTSTTSSPPTTTTTATSTSTSQPPPPPPNTSTATSSSSPSSSSGGAGANGGGGNGNGNGKGH